MTRTANSNASMVPPVIAVPSPTCTARKSAPVSPTVVAMILMIQKINVTSGTVPEVTLIFWIIKIMATTVGETGADFLAVHVGLGTAITGGTMLALLLAVLVIQLRSSRYIPWVYWLTIVLVSVVGTQ